MLDMPALPSLLHTLTCTATVVPSRFRLAVTYNGRGPCEVVCLTQALVSDVELSLTPEAFTSIHFTVW